jgi:ammonium transporter, Amt family
MEQNKKWSVLFLALVLGWLLSASITFAQEDATKTPAAPEVPAPGMAPAPVPAPSAVPTPAAAPQPKIDKGDTAWMLTSSALVLMMTIPG